MATAARSLSRFPWMRSVMHRYFSSAASQPAQSASAPVSVSISASASAPADTVPSYPLYPPGVTRELTRAQQEEALKPFRTPLDMMAYPLLKVHPRQVPMHAYWECLFQSGFFRGVHSMKNWINGFRKSGLLRVSFTKDEAYLQERGWKNPTKGAGVGLFCAWLPYRTYKRSKVILLDPEFERGVPENYKRAIEVLANKRLPDGNVEREYQVWRQEIDEKKAVFEAKRKRRLEVKLKTPKFSRYYIKNKVVPPSKF